MIETLMTELRDSGFSQQRNVLSRADLQHLARLFAQEFRPAKVGKEDGPKRIEEIRGDWIHWLDPLSPPEDLASIFSYLRALKSELNQQFYLGIKDFECHLAKYPPGTYYRKHLDRFESDSSRSVSFIFYLHESWDPEDGGELVLYDKNQNVLATILPEPGSLIVFLSADFPHEVKVCRKERRSLTGWMHTKILT